MSQEIKKKKWITPEIMLISTGNINAPYKNVPAGHEGSFRSHKSLGTPKGSTVPYAFFNDGHKTRIGNSVTANWFVS